MNFNLGNTVREREREMHLIPSKMIRDSFKHDYLVKLEWNLERMKRKKQSQKLLDNGEEAVTLTPKPSSEIHCGPRMVCKQILIALYSIFCCTGKFYFRFSLCFGALDCGFYMWVFDCFCLLLALFEIGIMN